MNYRVKLWSDKGPVLVVGDGSPYTLSVFDTSEGLDVALKRAEQLIEDLKAKRLDPKQVAVGVHPRYKGPASGNISVPIEV